MCTETTHTEELQAGRPGRRLATARGSDTPCTQGDLFVHTCRCTMKLRASLDMGALGVSTSVNSCRGNGYFNHMYYEATTVTVVT